ncbi:Hypothetical_protein [Hexamita inflata]|uniref:Hypothetical_protein n=1 Tax=Hexamita inflata TaxID=28002 RepID=A0AA86QF64_9EUKA|nr:Hypothetical protein HINF_LOCUS1315 [Hexamita inflata]CAI9951901.1 Hypothetical protein HINF_LOCUS39546 [Hexamita inflata]CAI9951904.1 Hypothetical protein HINF_LOCUS39549 [Hexamita inflata]
MLCAQFVNIYCYIELNNIFDYQNCYQLKCQYLKELGITNQVVNFSNLKGKLDELSFDNCEFTNYVSDDFQVENVYVTITQQHCKNNILSLYNINCDHLYVYFNDFSNYPVILKFPKSKQKSAFFKNCICDISVLRGKWNTLNFIDCILSRSPNKQIVSTKIVITNTKYFDLQALDEIKANLIMYLTNQCVNLDLIKPNELSLENCELQLNLRVIINKISITECDIHGSGQIYAKEIIIKMCKPEIFKKIYTESLTQLKSIRFERQIGLNFQF